MKLVNAGQASFPFAFHGYSACASYDRHYWCFPLPVPPYRHAPPGRAPALLPSGAQESMLFWGARALRLLGTQSLRLVEGWV